MQIFTDKGCNFESKLFVAVCGLLKIHKAHKDPYGCGLGNLKKLISYLPVKYAAMVDNHRHLKNCADWDISLWLARYREKF